MTLCPKCNNEFTKNEVSNLLLVFNELTCSSCKEEITIDPYYKELLAANMASTTIHTILNEPVPVCIKRK